MTITELAKINNITTSTVIFHTNILMDANLIHMLYRPGKKGKTQVFFLFAVILPLYPKRKYPANTSTLFLLVKEIGFLPKTGSTFYAQFSTKVPTK